MLSSARRVRKTEKKSDIGSRNSVSGGSMSERMKERSVRDEEKQMWNGGVRITDIRTYVCVRRNPVYNISIPTIPGSVPGSEMKYDCLTQIPYRKDINITSPMLHPC
jgi:hypothetical protein